MSELLFAFSHTNYRINAMKNHLPEHTFFFFFFPGIYTLVSLAICCYYLRLVSSLTFGLSWLYEMFECIFQLNSYNMTRSRPISLFKFKWKLWKFLRYFGVVVYWPVGNAGRVGKIYSTFFHQKIQFVCIHKMSLLFLMDKIFSLYLSLQVFTHIEHIYAKTFRASQKFSCKQF